MGDSKEMTFKIFFITQDDPFYVRLFFEEFFSIYSPLGEIAGVVIAKPMGKKSRIKLAKQMHDFYGTRDFLRMSARYAAYNLLPWLPEPLVRERRFRVADLCRDHGIPVQENGNINSEPFLSRLEEMCIDLLISVASPFIFKQDLISVPKLGCINIHNGALPKYRGMLPTFWQMYHDEPAVGITIHEIDPRLDTGRIILQRKLAVDAGETLDSLMRRAKRKGAHLMVEAIRVLRTGEVRYMENRASDNSYFSFPTKRDAKEFKRKGKRIL